MLKMAYGAEEPLGGTDLQILKIQGWCVVVEDLAKVTAILSLKEGKSGRCKCTMF